MSDPSASPTPAETELTNLVVADYRRLVGAVAVICGSSAVAEDAVQDALAKALERARRGFEFDHLAGWVVVVALNQTRQVARRAQAEHRAVTRLSAGRSDVTDQDDLLDLQQAVSALPGRQREVVVLHYLLDLDVRATADVLGVREGTVKTCLFRARAALAARLGDLDPEEERA